MGGCLRLGDIDERKPEQPVDNEPHEKENNMIHRIKKLALVGCLCILSCSLMVTNSMAAKIEVDPNLNDYVKVEGVAGNLNSVGSDTLNNLMTFWAESFRKKYPNVNIQIEGKGSSTAPPALIEGTAQLGPMSRKMKDKEIESFEAKYGFKPTTIGVALDSLAVYVNKDNPIDALDLEEVDAIFSKTRKGGAAQDVITWGQVGLTGEWANKPISLYGRNSASGTYGYFKSKALFKGDYKDTVKEQPGSASVVLGVTEDKNGIGYSGIGYKTSGVKAIALSKKGGDAYTPNYENVLSGKYPLGRLLYVNVVKEPNKPLPKLVKEFLKFVLSKEGQEIVVKDGYLPLTEEVAAKQLALLD
jgi:phosphate transport system substrate-binding protein